MTTDRTISVPPHLPNPMNIRYLTAVPTTPPSGGQVVVHNNVIPAKRLGDRGFRAWLQDPDGDLMVCDCSWAPTLDQHFRVAGLNDYRSNLDRTVAALRRNVAIIEQKLAELDSVPEEWAHDMTLGEYISGGGA